MEPPLAQHHEAVAPLDAVELRVTESLEAADLSLTSEHEAIFRYALNLARLRVVRRAQVKADVYVARELAPFRQVLIELLHPIIKARKPDWDAFKAKIPYLRQETRRFREELCARHGALISPDRLDQECREKKLVLALGGGGGAALAHLGVLFALEEAGITPALIAGTSMGAVLGLLRAMEERFDPLEFKHLAPDDFDVAHVIKRYSGQTTYGVLGVFSLVGYELAAELFKRHNGRGVPRLSELPIPLRVVVTGLKAGLSAKVEAAEKRIISAAPGRKKIWRRMLVSLATSAAELAEDPSLLEEVVFGADPGTQDFNAVDAVCFSAAIPGVIHYDVAREAPETTAALDRLFAERGLWRLCDGGAVENVPTRAAWESVQAGAVHTRNAFVLGCDCFAPRIATQRLVLFPIQQYVRANVNQSAPYANLVFAYHKTPTPFRLLGDFGQLEKITRDSRKEFEPTLGVLKRVLTPLPPWREIDSGADG